MTPPLLPFLFDLSGHRCSVGVRFLMSVTRFKLSVYNNIGDQVSKVHQPWPNKYVTPSSCSTKWGDIMLWKILFSLLASLLNTRIETSTKPQRALAGCTPAHQTWNLGRQCSPFSPQCMLPISACKFFSPTSIPSAILGRLQTVQVHQQVEVRSPYVELKAQSHNIPPNAFFKIWQLYKYHSSCHYKAFGPCGRSS